MECDFEKLSAFLGVEGQRNPDVPEEVAFYLCLPSGQLIVRIRNERSEVDIEILGADAAELFAATFECISISVHDETPSKLKPHVEMKLAGSSSDVCVFHLGGPPTYSCEFISVNIK